MSPKYLLSTSERLRLGGVGGKCRGYYLKREGGSLTPPLWGQKEEKSCKRANPYPISYLRQKKREKTREEKRKEKRRE